MSLGIGEIGLNKNTKNEATVFLEHLELAIKYDQQILIHTPHLADKYQGTKMILDMLCDDSRINPSRVLVDHVEEHTIAEVLDRGFWAGMTLYPVTKCTPDRAADMIEKYGGERLLANSAGDWGPSKPTAVPDLIFEMRRRGNDESLTRKVVYENPIEFFSQSKNFSFVPRENGRKVRWIDRKGLLAADYSLRCARFVSPPLSARCNVTPASTVLGD